MKLIILSSTILEFTWLVIDGFMEGTSPSGLKKWPGLPLPKRKLGPPLYRRFSRNLKLQSESFFMLEICMHYFLYREFSSLTWKKSLPSKVPIPTQNPDLTRSLVCKCSEKWLEFRVKNVNRNININSIRNNIDFLADHFFRDWDWWHFLDEWIYYYLC